jgi:hypothetical protein
MDYWKLNVYINEAGNDEVDSWLIGLPPDAEAAIRTFFTFLISQEYLREPFVKKIKGSEKIFELRHKHNRVQYRPLGCYGPKNKEFTLLIGAIKKEDIWNPPNAIKSAEKRCKLIHDNIKYVREYDE